MSRSSKRNRTSRNGYGRISKIISVFMALSMMLTLIPSNAIPVYAAQGDTPEHSKTSADNGDGTYVYNENGVPLDYSYTLDDAYNKQKLNTFLNGLMN